MIPMTMRVGRLQASVASLLLMLFGQAFAGQQAGPAREHDTSSSLVVVRQGRLSVRAENAFLPELLDLIGRRASFVVSVAPELETERVSVAFSGASVEEAVRRVAHNCDIFVYYSAGRSAPEPASVWVFPRGGGRDLAPLSRAAWASDADTEARLSDPDPEVRVRSLEALISRRGAAATSALFAALGDDNDYVRVRALQLAFSEALAIPAERLFDLALNDRSANVRLQALQTAPDVPELLAVAENAQNDPDRHVRDEARAILARLRSAAAADPAPERPPRP